MQVFDHDWEIAISKHALDAKLDKASKAFDPARKPLVTMEALKEAVFTHFDLLYNMFSYYACATTGLDLFTVSKQVDP